MVRCFGMSLTTESTKITKIGICGIFGMAVIHLPGEGPCFSKSSVFLVFFVVNYLPLRDE